VCLWSMTELHHGCAELAGTGQTGKELRRRAGSEVKGRGVMLRLDGLQHCWCCQSPHHLCVCHHTQQLVTDASCFVTHVLPEGLGTHIDMTHMSHMTHTGVCTAT